MKEKSATIERIKRLIRADRDEEALGLLFGAADPWDNFPLQHQYFRLWERIRRKRGETPSLKIGIVSTSSMEHFTDIFRFWLAKEGFPASVHVALYNTLDQTILDPQSELYRFSPHLIWLFVSHKDISCDVDAGSGRETVQKRLQTLLNRITGLWDAIRARLPNTYIFQNNVDLPVIRVFGNFEGSVEWGRQNFLRQFNLRIAQDLPIGVTIFDLEYLSSLFGRNAWFDERYWYHSKNAFSLDAAGFVAFHGSRLIRALKGGAKKCIVLDLDHTLWGGVVGDDGIDGIELGSGVNGEAYVDFQKYLLELKNRGIILAVCSKNDERNARLPFLKHPDMKLKLEDISVFVANWNNKADNLRSIVDTLGIGMDSVVYIDDNPVERELVKRMLPMVSVPDMPCDPTRYTRTLDQMRYFEAVMFSTEDKNRSEMYSSNLQRKNLQQKSTDLSAFLNDLEMKCCIGEFDLLHLPRIAQLINKSNQFHLTTTRYTEAEIKAIVDDPETVCRFFKLKDRFGDYGLISVLIMRKKEERDLYIDTWVMSCRVFSRSMEEFTFNEIVRIALKCRCSRIWGKYLPTPKNSVVSNLYEKLGFEKISEFDGATLWKLELDEELPVRTSNIEQVDAFYRSP
jgi:FkbH-like protein